VAEALSTQGAADRLRPCVKTVVYAVDRSSLLGGSLRALTADGPRGAAACFGNHAADVQPARPASTTPGAEAGGDAQEFVQADAPAIDKAHVKGRAIRRESPHPRPARAQSHFAMTADIGRCGTSLDWRYTPPGTASGRR